MSRYRALCVLGLRFAAATMAGGGPLLAADQQDSASALRGVRQAIDDDVVAPIAPARRALAAAPSPAPDLPPGADRVRPLTLHVAVRKHSADRVHAVTQTITRTVDRVHVSASGGSEWLFERNPHDGRRVSGHFVAHRERALVFYSDSDLRNVLGISGWAHVLTLGFDHRLLGTLPPAPEVRAIGEVQFARRPARAVGAVPNHVWWNDVHALPAEFASEDAVGQVRFSIDRISSEVDTQLLRPPTVRFPAYRLVDLADWLESH